MVFDKRCSQRVSGAFVLSTCSQSPTSARTTSKPLSAASLTSSVRVSASMGRGSPR